MKNNRAYRVRVLENFHSRTINQTRDVAGSCMSSTLRHFHHVRRRWQLPPFQSREAIRIFCNLNLCAAQQIKLYLRIRSHILLVNIFMQVRTIGFHAGHMKVLTEFCKWHRIILCEEATNLRCGHQYYIQRHGRHSHASHSPPSLPVHCGRCGH
jgi:hypothetical protein